MEKPNWNLGPQYTVGERIGKGTYGSVCEAIDNLTGEKVAIKSIKSLFEDEVEAKQLLREILIMRTLNHPNIVKIKNIVIPQEQSEFNAVYIVMEHAEADLKKLAKSRTFLDSSQVCFLMYQAVCGSRYMHSANILHRDLKPANILINSNCSLKICDFGLSRSYRKINQPFQEQASDFKKKVKRILTGHVVTRWYRAPEVILLEKEYGKEMDVWSLGCVFAEMLGMIAENVESHIERSALFPGRSCFPLSPDLKSSRTRAGYPCSESDQLNVIFEVIGTPDPEDLGFITDEKALRYVQSFPHIESRSLREYFPAASNNEIDLLSKMLQFNPRKRITLEEALNHPYFHEMRGTRLEVMADHPVDFVFDRDQELDMNELRELFRKEIMNN